MMKQKLFFMLLALCQAKFMSEREVEKLRNNYSQNLPLLVTSSDKSLIVQSIQDEYQELFGAELQASSLQEALQQYKDANLDQLSGPFSGVNNHEQLKEKFNQVIRSDIESQLQGNTNMTVQTVQDYYNHVLLLIKQYYAAVMKVNITTKDTTLEAEAKVSSVLIEYIAQHQANKETISQLETEIESQQDALEKYLIEQYSEKAKYFIRNQIENFVDFAYKIQVMAQEVSRGNGDMQNKERQQVFKGTLHKALSLLTVFFTANESGSVQHLVDRSEDVEQSEETMNRERKDYLFQTLVDEREYLMKQNSQNIEVQKVYGIFFNELVKKAIEVDSNPQDAVYMKQYLTHSRPTSNQTFGKVLDIELEQINQLIQNGNELTNEDKNVLAIKITDQIAFNKNITNEQVQNFREYYGQVAQITAPYMNNSEFLFFISDAGCHGDLKVNSALYDSIALFRTRYTLEVTSSNKYAISMFMNQFLDNLNEQYAQQAATEQTTEFRNYYFYLKFQIMIQMAAFVPDNVDGLFYFKPLTQEQEDFIDQNVNKLCIEAEKRNAEDNGKKKYFLSTLNGLVFYVLDKKVKPKQLVGLLTNKDVQNKEDYVGIDLKKVREVYSIQVESSEQVSSDILEKISKPQEFMMQAQLNQDTFERMKFEPSVQQTSEQEVINIDERESSSESSEEDNQPSNITDKKVQVDNGEDNEVVIDNTPERVQYNDPNGKNIVRVLYGEIDQDELEIFEDPRVLELLQGDESQHLMNKTNKDGDYIDATFVRIIPHNSPCQDDE